ncbi:hypothetical protein BKD09_16525 [Bradyrhizobium japonicum]|uniref:Uncharacterized protein n=1 Tax=Bradyrhizobium japonicum TaxID=375 RepID=A0A1L3F9K7_BRAJP|nr:hypothetical protein BKD09_16525 [Bradyrhizobium japonicum]
MLISRISLRISNGTVGLPPRAAPDARDSKDDHKARQDHQIRTYRELIGIAEEVIESARAALRHTRKARGKDMITDLAIAEARNEIEHFCGLGNRVIDQSRRRVLNGEQVPTVPRSRDGRVGS